jgi:hypothetical protein
MYRFFPLSALILAGSFSLLADVDLPLLNLAPAGSRVVFGANVTEARTSPFGQFILTRFNEATNNDPNFQNFIQETGFDPRQDVQSIVAAGSGNKTAPQNAVIVRAMFDQSKFEGTAQSMGDTIQNFQGVDMILFKNGKTEANGQTVQGAVAFLGSDILVAGDSQTVRQIISNRAAPTSLDPTLLSQIQKVGATNEIWFVSIVPGADLLTKMAPNPQQMQRGQVLQSILTSSGGVHLGDQVSLSFDAMARSAQDATSLSDVINFGAGMVEMQSQKDPNAAILSNALNNMNVSINGSSVHVALTLQEQDLEHLAQALPKHQAHFK